MRKIIVIQLFLLLFQNLYSQKGNKTLFKEYEDTLKLLSTTIIYATDEEERGKLANISFIENLSEVLEYEKSFKYPFELLPKEIILNSPNNHFRMFNWYLRKENNTYEYYAIIQYYNKIKQKYEVVNLKDNSENLRKPENKELTLTIGMDVIIMISFYIKKMILIFIPYLDGMVMISIVIKKLLM